jgi:ATP-dependent exoDNAse (exonuclease V) alpha subunit
MKQETALNILKLGKNVFITGSAGTGKTYILNKYIKYLKEREIYPSIVAPTGIAASHLKGQTIHSFFHLGIRESIDDGFIDYLLDKRYLRKRFDELQVLIIDEVSMISPEIFSAMDIILQSFKESIEPFGGVQVVLSGDFFQLPPVSKKKREKRFAWQSPSWKDLELKSCYLQEKFRQKDNKLIQVLDEIREGKITEFTHKTLESRFQKELNSKFTPTKLYTHNFDVDRINNVEIRKLKGREKLFVYESKGSKKSVEKIFKSSLVLEELILKKDAVVIFIKNNHEQGYVNGTTGRVVSFSKKDNLPIVLTSDGAIIKVDYSDWSIENDGGDVLATVSQIPLRLAWAITVHKSQGMTLSSAEIDLSKTFEVGQGYVALSRIKSIEGLRLLGFNEMALRVDPLILHIDSRIKRASKEAENEIDLLSAKTSLSREFNKYIRTLGGVVKKERKNSIDVEIISFDNI